MKQLLIIILTFITFIAVSQRNTPVFEKLSDADQLNATIKDLKDNDDLILLLPGNWENATDAVIYLWLDEEENYLGYVFGTNEYGDKAYGQRFIMDTPEGRVIHGVYYWFGFAEGTSGDAVFTMWDWDNDIEEPGEVIITRSIPLEDIESSLTFKPDPDHEQGPQPGAYYLEFDTPIEVAGDYVIGVDVTDLDSWQEDTYGLGNMSSVDGDGAEAGLTWIQEHDGGWVKTLTLGLDVDIAVFPVVEPFNRDVTFNVDMTDAQTENGLVFDPELHSVFVSGTFNDWVIPGEDDAYELQPGGEKIYTLTLNMVEGEHEYKYFLVEDDPTDDMGEWEGEPFRSLKVYSDMEVNDVFGDKPVSIVDKHLPEESLRIFPNPASSVLNIEYEGTIKQLRIFDITGKLVYSRKNDNNQARIDVGELKQGMYVLQVITEKGIAAQRFNVAR